MSIIQAITWAFVLTSGAGMSFSGPTRTSISVKNRRVSASSSLIESFFGSTITPPLPPPYGMPTTAHFQVIHIARALTSSRRHVLVVADAALGWAAAEVVLDAVAREDLDAAVVHVDREVNGELATGLAQDAAHPFVKVELLGGKVELALGHGPRVDRGGDVLGGHGSWMVLVWWLLGSGRRSAGTIVIGSGV